MTRPAQRKRTLDVIGFRLPPDETAELTRRAKSFGVSPHQLARSYVEAALRSGKESEDMMERLDDLHRELVATREDLALAAETLLQGAGNSSPEKAAEWAKENLNIPVEELEEAP